MFLWECEDGCFCDVGFGDGGLFISCEGEMWSLMLCVFVKVIMYLCVCFVV